MQQGALKGLVQLAAQAPYRHLHHIGLAVEIHVPDLLGQFGAGQHLALTPQQQAQQIEFLGREVQALPGALGASAYQVHLQLTQTQLGDFAAAARALGPPQQALDAGQQLREGEGLEHIVVGAGLQATHPVFHLGAGGEHQHRGVAALAQSGQHGQTVNAWQHAVQHDQIMLPLGGQVQAIDAVERQLHAEAFLAQALAQILGQLGFILDQQELHARIVRVALAV